MNVSNKLKVNNNEFIEIILIGLRGGGWVILLILLRDVAIERDFLITSLDIIMIIVLRILKVFGILINVNLMILRILERVDTAIVDM